VLEAEQLRSAKPFEHDPYGCTDPGLQRKRRERNPFRRSVSYPRGYHPNPNPSLSQTHTQTQTQTLTLTLTLPCAQVSYPRGCPEIAPLLAHCSTELFNGPLPWHTLRADTHKEHM